MNSGPYRLPSGGLIDRARVVTFTFDGRTLQGFKGDTLAAALLANGVRVVARSMKFHRPRGVFSSGIEEPNALVRLGEGAAAIPSARATVTSLTEGISARAQSGWPSVQFDLLRALDFAAPLFAAGFYNKTFMWPSWHAFEPFIRRLAGLGRSPTLPDPDRYETRNAHCELLVVGGGIAGLSAALAAARRGQRVLLVEQEEEVGGWARWSGAAVEGLSAESWIGALVSELRGSKKVRILTRATAVGSYDHGVVTLCQSCSHSEGVRERFWIVRTRRMVLATGAMEQPLVFDNNDRPGVMLAGSADRYLKSHAVAPGRRVLIATNNDSAYAVARDLMKASVSVVGIADSRERVTSSLVSVLRSAGVPVYLGTIPVTTAGSRGVRAVTLGAIGKVTAGAPFAEHVACDALLVSGGWNPNLQLYSHARGKISFNESAGALVAPSDSAIAVVGAAALVSDVGEAIAHAARAGKGEPPQNGLGTPMPLFSREIGIRVAPHGNQWRQWVDLQHDVTVGDLRLAIRENFRSIEHVKRYTTVGMAVDQGKTSTLSTIQIVADLQSITPGAVGHTTMRPPYTPVTTGAIAAGARGIFFAPWRETPLYAWHVDHGGVMEEYGEWRRAACYRKAGEERAAAVDREARLVRSAAGLFDGSSLGKIEIQGPDALAFVDRFYINRLDTLKPGRVRYGIMLRENGVVFDDGTIVALEPTRVLITTTSGNAARVAAWLEEWRQCEWPTMRVAVVPVTEQWATLSLSGPRARKILASLQPTCDLAPEAFGHLAFRTATLLEAPARIYRVSFSGELTYEINVPPRVAVRVWEALLAAGASEGLDVYGVEALMQLRLEKGYLHLGADTDGTTVPDDIGWGAVASAKTRDFIGKRSLALLENRRPDRLQLIGLRHVDGLAPLAGAHVKIAGSDAPSDGWITSAGRLTSEGIGIGLALVRSGRAHLNKTVSIHDGGRQVGSAMLIAPPFYDTAGDRLNA